VLLVKWKRLIRDFIKSSTNVLFADIGTKAIGFALISILTFVLDPVSLGKYNALLTTIASIYGMSGLGIAMVLQRESAKHTLHANSLIGERVSAGFIAMILTIIILVFFFQVFHNQLTVLLFGGMDSDIIQWIPVLTLLYFAVQAPLTLLLGMGLFRTYSFRSMMESFITGVCVLVGIFFWQLEGIIYGLIISYTINAIIVWMILKKSFLDKKILLVVRNFIPNTRRLLKEGIPYFIGNTFLGAVASIILIGLFSAHIGFAELGYLRLGLSLAAILMIVPNAAKTVTISFIARHEMNATKLQSLQIRYLFFLATISTMVMMLLLSPVVDLIFGKEYESGLVIYTMVILISIFFNIQQILNTFVAGRGDLLLSGIVNSCVTILYIGGSLFLIPSLGIFGYYIAFGGSYLLGFVVLMAYDLDRSRYTDKGTIVRFLFGTMAFIFLSIAYTIWFERSWTGDLMIWALLLLYSFACVKYVFTPEEKEYLQGILRKVRFKQI